MNTSKKAMAAFCAAVLMSTMLTGCGGGKKATALKAVPKMPVAISSLVHISS